jgi:hypothetical protein
MINLHYELYPCNLAIVRGVVGNLTKFSKSVEKLLRHLVEGQPINLRFSILDTQQLEDCGTLLNVKIRSDFHRNI